MSTAPPSVHPKIEKHLEAIEASKLFKKRIAQTLLSAIFIILGIAGVIIILGCIVAFVALIIFYILQNKIANIILTVFQVITGLLSLVVGIWGLCLALQARKNTTPPVGGITMAAVSPSPRKTVGHESDVDMDSIG